MHDCHRMLSDWMQALGMQVRVDAIGNIRGLYPGKDNARRLLVGSHLDTVPNAGAYDGVLGVVLPIVLIESLEGERLPFGIEVIGFSEEEGVRFGRPFLGSNALTGRIDNETLEIQDSRGISVKDAIGNFGLDVAQMRGAILNEEAFAYLEFHIEQGPVLESLDRPLGVVDAIAGQSRVQVTFRGAANHAGTTPMHLRRDALTGAAEWVSTVEKMGRSIPGLVATVGVLEASPGASNIVPGTVRATLDVRHAEDEFRTRVVEGLIESGNEIATQRDLRFEVQLRLNQAAVAMDRALAAAASRAISRAGCVAPRMVSGAGHDAMIMAEKIPSAMIFLRTPGGISHHPDETVRPEDVEIAISAGEHLLRELAGQAQ